MIIGPRLPGLPGLFLQLCIYLHFCKQMSMDDRKGTKEKTAVELLKETKEQMSLAEIQG